MLDAAEREVPDADEPICSARGCRSVARWLLVWNNPRVHTPDREKTWAACSEHREHLAQHLGVRGFLRRVDPLTIRSTP